MAKARQAWPLALVLWLCLALVTWAQVQVGGGGGSFIGGSVSTSITPTPNNTIDLGSGTLQWRDLFVARSIQGGAQKTLTETVATGFVTVTVGNSSATAGRVVYTIRAADATDTQSVSGELFFSCIATSASVVTCGTISDQHTQNPVSAGTLTNTMTNTTGANTVTLLSNATSSLTQTVLRIEYRVELFGNSGTAVSVTGL